MMMKLVVVVQLLWKSAIVGLKTGCLVSRCKDEVGRDEWDRQISS